MSSSVVIADTRCRTLAKFLLDLLLVSLSLVLAFELRFDGERSFASYAPLLFQCLPIVVTLRLLALWVTTRYQLTWRYVSLHDAAQIAASTLLSTCLLSFVLLGLMGLPVPRFLLLIDSLLSLALLCAVRVFFRVLFPVLARHRNGSTAPRPLHRRRILIVGAGGAGEHLARAAHSLVHEGWELVGFVDDDPAKRGRRIHGRPVLGPISALPEVLESRSIDEVLVALPEPTGKRVGEIISLCEKAPAHLSIVPKIEQYLDGEAAFHQAREIKPEDLLERDPVILDAEQVRSFLSGHRVLITGAGGSIGSEICRQVAEMGPEVLIMLGRGENSIFEAIHELQATSKVKAIPVIASVQDKDRMRAVFETFRPTLVLHAAAHKHVPLMEAFPTEAIQTNVLGTRNIVNLSDEFGVKKMVLISTDKAVNPSSIMGASKRLAEMVLQAKSTVSQTEFVAVRFGNVLGSRGSVVPTMQRQIQRGGPVTVTHPDMTRYFMTIPEAVQLVLQAGAIGRSGEVFVLDMGSPVKIMDLARNLIRLSGRVPGRDIAIEFVGPRPGEKLHEDLMTAEEGVTATRHKRLAIAKGQVSRLSLAEFTQILSELEEAVRSADDEKIRRLLPRAIPTYTPDPHRWLQTLRGAEKRGEQAEAPKA
ncbi:MAG TPA: nucleoside-diphosphate sugar epimerase/dehydratase [Armatimonadota bacterium]|jgi:FlaA1/EpsC-like NDP-sugar epimerase